MLALVALMMGAGRQHDGSPFVMTALFFLASFKSLGAMFWPYMIPYSIAGGAAAPDASLQFLFYGGIVVLPVVLVYAVGVYWVFGGRIRKS